MSSNSFPAQATPQDANPAIQLFGKRLFGDQSPVEFLIELLLLTDAPKHTGDVDNLFSSPLPEFHNLVQWPASNDLHYAPKVRLNLKLFAFLGASRLDSRHETHRRHYRDYIDNLLSHVRVTDSGSEGDVLRTLENLFLGFQGAGSGRTWCAQSFLPICRGVLAGETIWNETAARRFPPADWHEVLDRQQDYLTMNKHRFLARGGEVLYLQICNALRQDAELVRRWGEENGITLEPSEMDPKCLHFELQRELNALLNQCPPTVTEIADFLDRGVESETAKATDTTTADGQPRFVEAGWCPVESWHEGYLFTVDLLRLCKADLDIIERLQLLEAACAMQVIRSLAMQSARHSGAEFVAEWPGYRMAVSAPDEQRSAVKRISRHTAKMMEKMIYRALRSDDVELPQDEAARDKILKEADRRYGGKLFVSLAKRIGLLVPRRGAGARFTMNEILLRLLVTTTVPAGGRLTYDRFKELVEKRHGLVFDAAGLARASAWTDRGEGTVLDSGVDLWLQEMLAAAGLLIHLSDACALVVNPAARKGETK